MYVYKHGNFIERSRIFPRFVSRTFSRAQCKSSDFLNHQFPGKWIRRGGGPIAWPSRSSDLTPLDFFLWGVHKVLGVRSEAAIYRRTASPYNCSLWDSYSSDAAEHLARGRVSSGDLSDHQVLTYGDQLGNIKTWKLSAYFSMSPVFLSILV
jgi:hypothetical protein